MTNHVKLLITWTHFSHAVNVSTWQTSRSEERVLWFQGMELPEVIQQLSDEITAFTVHVFLPVLWHFWVRKRRT